ncbi:MAG: YbaY family lipoprotein [Acidimicrobiales bacterium]
MSEPEQSGQSVQVVGRIVLPSADTGRRPPRAAVVTVSVEDTSRADAASTVIAEQRLTDVDLTAADDGLTFVVEVPASLVDRQARYSVRVHVDIGGTGEVSEGDFVSTRSHPALNTGQRGELTIPVITV